MSDSLKKIYYRIYQTGFKLAMPLLPWRKPELLEGQGSIKRVPEILSKLKINNVLIVTDAMLVKLGLLDSLLKALDDSGCTYALYDKTVPDPTVENVEEALETAKAVQEMCHRRTKKKCPKTCAVSIYIGVLEGVQKLQNQ